MTVLVTHSRSWSVKPRMSSIDMSGSVEMAIFILALFFFFFSSCLGSSGILKASKCSASLHVLLIFADPYIGGSTFLQLT